jgi:hypothetical protein
MRVLVTGSQSGPLWRQRPGPPHRPPLMCENRVRAESQHALQTQEAADAIEHDGVIPETLVILVESSGSHG